MSLDNAIVVVKFFRNERQSVRLDDTVNYNNKTYTVQCKAGKYLSLRDPQTNELLRDIKISDVESKSRNNLVTRSLGKIGVIDNRYTGPQPGSNDLWLCTIVEEIHPGKNVGCFILKPLRALHPDKVDRLIPGMYTTELVNGCLIITPTKLKDKDGDVINWMLSVKERRGMDDNNADEAYSIIVILGYAEVE